jgi:hypothetical protein
MNIYATQAGDACHRAQPWFCESQVPSIDHTEGGKYRMLGEEEMLEPGDEFLFVNQHPWYLVGAFHPAVPGQKYRRPVKSEEPDLPDYAQQAKDILQNHFGYFADIRDAELDTFVDLILKAAKHENMA